MKAKTGRKSQTNSLRIIAGRWRGRRLAFPDIDGLRPTGDRLRETLFNWLAPLLPGGRCLDLFAGAGGLGLEAASRGADQVVMIEKHPAAISALKQHCQQLQANNVTVIRADACQWLQSPAGQAFDIVFLDPPFQADLWQQCIDLLSREGQLAEGAMIYIESQRGQLLQIPESWHLYREKRAGEVDIWLYQHLP